MRLDKLFARRDFAAHKDVEDFIGALGVFDRYLLNNAVARVHGGFPELFGVHLTQTFVALDIEAGSFGFGSGLGRLRSALGVFVRFGDLDFFALDAVPA